MKTKDIDFSKIKCVVFDFDCTLYSKGSWTNSDLYCLDFLKKYNIAKTRDDFKLLVNKYPDAQHNVAVTFMAIREHGVPDEELKKYLSENLFNFLADDIITINPDLMKAISEKYPVYILSDSSEKYIDHYLKLFMIEKNWFKGCFSNKFLVNDMSKKPYMKKIVDLEKLKPENVLIVGDSELCDIKPARELGLQSFLVKTVYDTQDIIKFLLKIKVGD